MKIRQFPYMAPEKDPAGGGAGGGGEGGEAGVTRDEVQKMINGAVTGHFKRLDIPGLIKKGLEDAVGGLDLSALKGGGEGEKEKQKPGAGDSEDTKALRAKIVALENESKAERSRREEAEAKRLRGEEDAILVKSLREAGITDEVHVEAAMALHRSRNRIRRNKESDAIEYAVQKDGYEETLPIQKAIGEWAKGDEGKRFLPARQAGGSGSSGGGGRPPAAGDKGLRELKGNEREKKTLDLLGALSGSGSSE